MLEGLDQVNWDSLSGPNGSVENVPQYIRGLLSTDETEWERAYSDLHSSIWHQGTVYSVTAYVVPFLAELLAYEFVINRDWILMGLLPVIADGHSYFDVHYHLDPVWADEYLAEQETNIETQLQQELGYVKRAREAVLDHADTYLRLLNHEKPELVLGSVTLLSDLVELSASLYPRFKQLYAEDGRLWVRNSILHGIRKLNVSLQAKSDFFEPIFDQEKDHFLKSAAALGAFEAQQSNYRTDIFDYLVELCRFLDQETEYGWLDSDPWGGPYINIEQIFDACLTITSPTNIIEIKHIATVLESPRLFRLVHKLFFKLFALEVGGETFFTAAWSEDVRTVTFFEDNISNPVQLTKGHQSVPENYKLVVEFILQVDKFWEVKSNMLNIFGFPHSRDELRKLI